MAWVAFLACGKQYPPIGLLVGAVLAMQGGQSKCAERMSTGLLGRLSEGEAGGLSEKTRRALLGLARQLL